MMPLQSGSNINVRPAPHCSASGEMKTDGGEEKGSDTAGEREREKEKQRRRYLCLTDEHRGRMEITVDGKAEKYQGKRGGQE